MRRSVPVALLAVLALAGCDETIPSETDLSCQFESALPRTIEVSLGTAVELRFQCAFAGDVGAARERALAATLSVSGAEASLDESSFTETGLLSMLATVTAGEGDEPDRGTLTLDEPTATLATGRLFFHLGDDALRTEHAGQLDDACLVVCTDATGRQDRAHFEGATCGCGTPILASIESADGLPVYTWTHVLVSHGQLQLVVTFGSGLAGETERVVEAIVEIPGLDPETLVHQEHQLILNGAGQDPHLLWWGVAAGEPVHAAMVPLRAEGPGTPIVLALEGSLAELPPVFVASMELHQLDDPATLPRPMVLYGYQTLEGPLGWALVELFSGTSGTEAGIFAVEPLWGDVSPEEVQAGTANVGLTRIGAAELDPRRGIAPDAEARAWSVRPDPADASRMLVSLYVGAGSLTLESQGSLPVAGNTCWNIGPAPGGFVLGHRGRAAEGASVSSSSVGGGAYFASAVGEALGLAPLHDFAGNNLFEDADPLERCEVATPSTWPVIPVDDGSGDGAVWARPGWRLNKLRAVTPATQVRVAVGTAPAGGTSPLTPTHEMPLLFADPEMPGELAGTLRALANVNGGHVALTQPLSTSMCTPEEPCSTPIATASDDSGRGFHALFRGNGAATVVAAAYGDIILGMPEFCWDFEDRIAPPVIFTNAAALDTVIVLTGTEDGDFLGQVGAIHVDELGQHDGMHPLALAGDAGPVVHTLLVDDGAGVFLRASGRGALSLERAERADLIDLGDGVTTSLVTTTLGTVDSVSWDETSPLLSFTATAPGADASPVTPRVESVSIVARDDARWASLLHRDGPCGAVTLVVGAADGSLTEQEFSPASADGSCEGVERGALAGDFLGTGGMQVVTARRQGTTLGLRLLYLAEGGLFAVDFATVALPYAGAPLRFWGTDLDHDGLADLMLDMARTDGVVLGLSDGLGGTRGGMHTVAGVSEGLGPVPGPAPGIAAHFGKGTKMATSTTSARPQLL